MGVNPLIEAIATLLAFKREELMPKLDEIEMGTPSMARQIQGVRNFVNRVYDSLPGAATEVFSEVLKLIKTGSGPVSHDPSDHV